jgi:hypothetical protein
VLETILNNSSSFGKFNAILFFKNRQLSGAITSDVRNLFMPDEVHESFFDLDNSEILDSHIHESTNVIRKDIFVKTKENLILECYKDNFIIEHLFNFQGVSNLTGHAIIRKYFESELDSKLILGFELSIDIENFSNSLKRNINEISFYPILVVDKTNDNILIFKEHFFDKDEIYHAKIKSIREYLECLQLGQWEF